MYAKFRESEALAQISRALQPHPRGAAATVRTRGALLPVTQAAGASCGLERDRGIGVQAAQPPSQEEPRRKGEKRKAHPKEKKRKKGMHSSQGTGWCLPCH